MSIIVQHFGYENISDFDYVNCQKELLQKVNKRIESGESTQFTLELRQELNRKISEAEAGGSPWERKQLFSFLTIPAIK